MAEGSQPNPPLAEAMRWVARIFAAAVVMVAPGIVGLWLDQRLDTAWVGFVGFATGLPLGMYFLIVMTRQGFSRQGRDLEQHDVGDDTAPAESADDQ